MSDMYLPKDFSDDPHESLSRDMKTGVYLGELVKVYRDEDYSQMLDDDRDEADMKAKKESEYAERHAQDPSEPLSPSKSSEASVFPGQQGNLVELDQVPSCSNSSSTADLNTNKLMRSSSGSKHKQV